jgi:predicted CoA-binding protein
MTTMTIAEAADQFLAHKRIAVAGVSRQPDGMHSGNGVFERLDEKGYEVFAINPHADEVDDDRWFASLSAIPGGVEAVVIATNPEDSASVMKECAELGIEHVWIHRSFGGGSYSKEAVDIGLSAGLHVIPSGCPLMFGDCSDGGHRFMKTILTWTGKVPKEV